MFSKSRVIDDSPISLFLRFSARRKMIYFKRHCLGRKLLHVKCPPQIIKGRQKLSSTSRVALHDAKTAAPIPCQADFNESVSRLQFQEINETKCCD